MRKSPFSTPRGNGWGGFGWKSNASPGRGYGRPNNFDYHQSPIRNKNLSQSTGDDFIPFDANISPSNNHNSGNNRSSPAYGNWQNAGRGNYRKSSPGFNQYCIKGGWENHRHSPYLKNRTNNFRGNRKNFHRADTKKKPNIAGYVNLASFLEDPWCKLLTNMRQRSSFRGSMGRNIPDVSFKRKIVDTVRLDASVDKDNSRSRESIDDGIEVSSSDLATSQDSID